MHLHFIGLFNFKNINSEKQNIFLDRFRFRLNGVKISISTMENQA